VLCALQLPPLMIVSDAEAIGIDAWVMKLARHPFESRLLVQIREKGVERLRVQHLLQRVLARAGAMGSQVVVNSDCGAFPQSSGVHLTSKALMAAAERPSGSLVGASAHNEVELEQVARLGLDYAVVGPVKPTPSHADAIPLGWARFEELIQDRPMPSYAIGGLTRADLGEARRRGAHGVALRGAAFSP
jgi:8-oxo-dGTP diphosphatase